MNKSEIQNLPLPWRHNITLAIGGLFQVGYSSDSDFLLILSAQGRGIINCLTGERVARDYQESHDFFDPIKLTAPGFALLDGQKIRMAGLYGGGLPRITADGWFLEDEASNWPTHNIYLTAPAELNDEHIETLIGSNGDCELRAYGFSETGRSFIIATSCEVVIFAR